jgi:hypothetical protein
MTGFAVGIDLGRKHFAILSAGDKSIILASCGKCSGSFDCSADSPDHRVAPAGIPALKSDRLHDRMNLGPNKADRRTHYRLFCGRVCTRPAGQTLSVGALREIKRLHQGGAEIPFHKLVLDAATQEIRP